MAVIIQQGTKQFRGAFTEMWLITETVADFADAAVGSGTFASLTFTVPGVALGDIVLGVSVGVSTTNAVIGGVASDPNSSRHGHAHPGLKRPGHRHAAEVVAVLGMGGARQKQGRKDRPADLQLEVAVDLRREAAVIVLVLAELPGEEQHAALDQHEDHACDQEDGVDELVDGTSLGALWIEGVERCL